MGAISVRKKRRCVLVAGVTAIVALTHAMWALYLVRGEGKVVRLGLDSNVNNGTVRAPAETQQKILRILNSPALLTDMEKPRPLFEFNLQPTKKIEAMKGKNKEVRWTAVNMIKSAITNRPRRDAIRETWGGVHLWKGVQITTIFILGNTSNKELQKNVEQEYREFGDILQINAEEDYKLVPYKTLAGMQWAGEVLPSNWLYSSGDDDIALHVSNFVRFVESTVNQTGNEQSIHKMDSMPIMCIYAYSAKDPPARNPKSKWYMPKERYPPLHWPPYCRGGWYSIPVANVARLYNVSRRAPFLRLDDVWITGLMRIKMLATREDVPENAVLGEAIIPAPLATRNDGQLANNVGEDDFSKVIVSHMWGNIKGRTVNVTLSLREVWKKWKVETDA